MKTVEQTKRLANFNPQENENMAKVIAALKRLQEQGGGNLLAYLREINADQDALTKLERYVNEETN